MSKLVPSASRCLFCTEGSLNLETVKVDAASRATWILGRSRCDHHSHNTDASASAQDVTCARWPSLLHACLSSTLRQLRALGVVPVYDGRQPLADTRVAVALHMRHIQKSQRSYNIGMQHALEGCRGMNLGTTC